MALYEETDIAWAAGFLDGEGCFRFYANRNGASRKGATWWQINLSAGQNHLAPLMKLQVMFGGIITPHPSKPKHHRWVIARSEELRIALPQLIPYLIVKRDEAKLLLEFANTYGPQGRNLSSETKDKREQLLGRLEVLRAA